MEQNLSPENLTTEEILDKEYEEQKAKADKEYEEQQAALNKAYNTEQARLGMEKLLKNERALELLGEYAFKVTQSEDCDMWATPKVAAVITGIVALAILGNDLEELVEIEECYGFYDSEFSNCGDVVIATETDDELTFEDAPEENYYITIFNE